MVAALRLTAFLTLSLTLAPVQMALLTTRSPAARHLPRLYHRLLLWILGITLRRHGAPPQPGQVMVVANHASYLDIPVLGALYPASFVAKAEVARWPVLGWLAQLQRTVFIARKRSAAARQRGGLARRLDDGESLIVFPEGTTSDGNRVLAFKSSLLSVCEAPGRAALPVQPVSIACTGLDGLPLGRDRRAYYAWYGDMDLLTHLWQFLALGKVTVDVVVHPPLTLAGSGSRKALARACQAVVAQGHQAALRGAIAANAGPVGAGRP